MSADATPELPGDAIQAAAVALHDLDCDDADSTETCGRWQSGDRYPSPQGVTHVSYYQDRARNALAAALPLIAARAAAAERRRILVDDETLHTDGSIGPDTAPPWGGDAAYWYRRWLFAAKQLDEEGAERMSAYAGMRSRLETVVATAARKSERQKWTDALGPPFDASDYREFAGWMQRSVLAHQPWAARLREIADLLEGDPGE